MGIVFKNNAKTTLASSLSNSATSATVTDGSVFPSLNAGEFFLITFDDGSNNEICKCTARSSNTLTIVRAQESTTARAFSSGDAAEGRVTAGVLEQIQENIASKSANQTIFNATTAGGATTYNIGTNPGVEANAMVFLNGVLQHHDTLSFSGTNLTFDAAPPNGMALEVIIDNLINLQSSNLTVDTFTAADITGNNTQTDFVLSDTPAAETNLIVFVDGVFQDQDAYTISSNTLTITTGVIAGRGVTVYVINPVNIGTPSDSTVTSSKLSGDITMPGGLIVGSNDVAFDSPTFVVDHTNSRVGLGTASPSVPVDIVGDVKMSANLTVDTNTLVVDSSNNRVGMGGSPVTQLHAMGGNGVIFDNPNNGYSGLKITDDTSGDYNINFLAGRSQGGTKFRFFRYGREQNVTPWSDYSSPVEIAHISGGSNYFAGNVGIGTASANNETNRVSLELDDTWGGVFQNSVSGTPKSEWRWNTSGHTIFGSVANEDLAFVTNNSERARITSGGNFSFNYGTGNTGNKYFIVNSGSGNDGGMVFQRENTNKWQINNEATTEDLNFYAYGAGQVVLHLDQDHGHAVLGNGVGLHTDTLRSVNNSITSSYSNVLDFSTAGATNAGRGFYLVTVVREGASVGTSIVLLVGLSTGSAVIIYDTISSNSLVANASGGNLQIKSTGGSITCHATAVPIGVTGLDS